MKIQRMFRISLLLCWMTSMLWTMAIPVKAEQTEATADRQTVEAQQQEEEVIRIENIDGLNDEFEALEEESVFIVEEVERYRKEAKRKRSQKVIVMILVTAIFGAGMITSFQEKKKKDPALTDKEKDKAEEETGGQT